MIQVHGNCTYTNTGGVEYILFLKPDLTLNQAIESCKSQGMSLIADESDLDVNNLSELTKNCKLFPARNTHLHTWLNVQTSYCGKFQVTNGNNSLSCSACNPAQCSGRVIITNCKGYTRALPKTLLTCAGKLL